MYVVDIYCIYMTKQYCIIKQIANVVDKEHFKQVCKVDNYNLHKLKCSLLIYYKSHAYRAHPFLYTKAVVVRLVYV